MSVLGVSMLVPGRSKSLMLLKGSAQPKRVPSTKVERSPSQRGAPMYQIARPSARTNFAKPPSPAPSKVRPRFQPLVGESRSLRVSANSDSPSRLVSSVPATFSRKMSEAAVSRESSLSFRRA